MKEEAKDENYFQDTKQKIHQYINQRILLLRLQVAAKASQVASALITAVLLVVIALFVLVFVSFTAAYWLAEVTDSTALGFGIVAVFYLLVFLFVLFFLRKIVRNFFVDKFIKLIHKKD